jgi:hypothetical protein
MELLSSVGEGDMAGGNTPWFEWGRGAGDFIRGLQASGVAPGGPAEPAEGAAKGEGAFPEAGVDIFLSHFVIALRLEAGDRAGDLITLSLPAAVQTVARTQPFVHDPAGRERRALALPEGATLPDAVREEDFQVRPKGFFRAGAETVLLQILNLDARAETPYGPVRIILGETFKREYEDLFEPSFGAAQALGARGFPAQLFFSPNAIIESPFGTVKTRPKALVGARISEFPPVGSHPSLVEPVPLDTVEALRAGRDGAAQLQAAASIVGLSHPIDAVIFEAGDPAFRAVERSASR